MLIIFPGTQSKLLAILFVLFTLRLPLGKRILALVIPYINYIESHFLTKRETQEVFFVVCVCFPYKMTFVSGALKVQKRPPFLLPQFIIDSGDSYVKAWN